MEPRRPFDERFPDGPPLFGCAGCHRDFASPTAFDQHFDRFDGRIECGALNGFGFRASALDGRPQPDERHSPFGFDLEAALKCFLGDRDTQSRVRVESVS
jgi:hypothetical protein